MQEEEGVSVQETESASLAEEKGLPSGIHKYRPVVTLLICVILSLILMKTGLLSIIYLMPLGYAIIVSGNFLSVFIAAAAVNLVMVFFQPLSGTVGVNYILLEALYLISVLFGFSWITGGKYLRTAYRFVIASAVCAVLFLILINSPSFGILKMLNEAAEEILNNYNLKPEENAKNLLFMQTLTPQGIVELARTILLRGGALVSILFLFFINRQIAVTVVSVIKKQKIEKGLTAFYAPVNTIWVLSGSLASIVLAGIFKIEILEIISWNVFVLCAIIFMAQGAGILMFWMSLRSNVFRLIVNVLIVVVLFSPLNIFALAAFILLGIIDNWRPFRIEKSAQ
jgi:hypothetical protein